MLLMPAVLLDMQIENLLKALRKAIILVNCCTKKDELQ